MLREHIYPGMTAWAAWGDTGWSAVRVMMVVRLKKNVKVERVDPKTEAPITRKAKARVSELVKRDPKKKGADKPAAPPAEVFAEQRKKEAEAKAAAEIAKAVVAVPKEPVDVLKPAVEQSRPMTQADRDARAEEVSNLLRETIKKFGYSGNGDW